MFGGSGAPAAGGGLFSNANAGSNLFGGASKPAEAKNEDDDDDDEEEEGEKSPPIYADSTKIEFKGAGAQNIKPSPYTKVFEVSDNLNRNNFSFPFFRNMWARSRS